MLIDLVAHEGISQLALELQVFNLQFTLKCVSHNNLSLDLGIVLISY